MTDNDTVRFVLIAVLALCFFTVLAFFLYMGFLSYMHRPNALPFAHQQMYFAYGVLFTMAVLLIIAATLYIATQSDSDRASSGKEIFDSFIKVLPPIAALILGYYFGTSRVTDSKPPSTQESMDAESKEAPPTETKK